MGLHLEEVHFLRKQGQTSEAELSGKAAQSAKSRNNSSYLK